MIFYYLEIIELNDQEIRAIDCNFYIHGEKKINNSLGREHELHQSLEKPSRFDMDEWLEMGVA